MFTWALLSGLNGNRASKYICANIEIELRGCKEPYNRALQFGLKASLTTTRNLFLSIFDQWYYYSCPNCPPCPPLPSTPLPPAISPALVHVHGSWNISSLASSFPILSLTSSCLFSTYNLCFLISAHLPPFFPLPLPSDNPPNDLHTYDSLPVLVVCLVCFFRRFSCW